MCFEKSENWEISWEGLPDLFLGFWRDLSQKICLQGWDHNRGNILRHIYAPQRCHKNKWPGKLPKKILLLHDNIPAHKAALIQKLFADFQWDIFPLQCTRQTLRHPYIACTRSFTKRLTDIVSTPVKQYRILFTIISKKNGHIFLSAWNCEACADVQQMLRCFRWLCQKIAPRT